MTSIEILATIFAILVLVKLLIIFIRPESWIKVSEVILKEGILITIIYLVLAVVVGYYVFTNLNVVQVAAVMLFTTILIALNWVPYSKTLLILGKEIIGARSMVFSKNWLSILIWAAIAIWVLYTVFA